MTKLRATIVATVMAVALVGGQAPAFAGGSPDNIVEVRNTKDGAFKAKSRAVVTHAPGGTVGNNNVATAWATCVGCRTTAAAVQVVIIEGSYSTFDPGNLAAAINDNCDTCETFAFARQHFFDVGHPVPIGNRAEDQIDDINDQMAQVIRSRDDFPTMVTELDALTQALIDVVRGEIDRSGSHQGEDDHRDVQEH